MITYDHIVWRSTKKALRRIILWTCPWRCLYLSCAFFETHLTKPKPDFTRSDQMPTTVQRHRNHRWSDYHISLPFAYFSFCAQFPILPQPGCCLVSWFLIRISERFTTIVTEFRVELLHQVTNIYKHNFSQLWLLPSRNVRFSQITWLDLSSQWSVSLHFWCHECDVLLLAWRPRPQV